MESKPKDELDRGEIATIVVVWILNLLLLSPFLYALALLLLSYCTGFGSEEAAVTPGFEP